MIQHPAIKMLLLKLHGFLTGVRCISVAMVVSGSIRVSIMSDQTSALESALPPSILVVDDCQDIQKLIGAILSPMKVRLEYASGGEEGLRMAASSVPALILLDYQMTDCDGLEVLRRLRLDERLARIPVMMITADNDQTLIARAFVLGVCDYINKPFLPIELRARVRSALGSNALIEDLRHQARFDSLTGLPNKSNFVDRIQRSINQSLNRLPGFAILFIDLDRFKWINDSLGHSCGDQALQEASQRLRACVQTTGFVAKLPAENTVSRFGGDEFVVLLESISGTIDAERVASRILEAMRQPFLIAGRTLHLSASIGVVNSHGQYGSPEEVIRDADIAMYEAKEAGRGCYRIFDAYMGSRALKRWQIDSDLRKAIEYNQFFLQYQPILCLETGLVESVEALIRWNHPEYGMIPPNDFIPMAEETGLIVSIGEWVLQTALKQFSVWQKLSPDATPKELNINLSRQQLVQPGFSSLVEAYFREYGVDASKVHFEITESELMNDLQASVQSIEELRAMGAKIDLDDFGTGYSSLACLHQLPIDVLKLDRSLISQLEQGGQYAKLVDLVLKLLSETEVKVIAEGIETQDQFHQLQRLHCQLGQGFLFSRPIDADKVQEFVRNRQNERAGFLRSGMAQSSVFIPKLMSIPMIKSI